MTGLLVSSPSASRKLQGDSSLAPASSQVELVIADHGISYLCHDVHLGNCRELRSNRHPQLGVVMLLHARCLQHAAVCLLVMSLVALQLPAHACSNVIMPAPYVPAIARTAHMPVVPAESLRHVQHLRKVQSLQDIL